MQNLLMYRNFGYENRPYNTHFASPDTLIPDPRNPLDYNRYAYARFNPLKYTDPSGHICVDTKDGKLCSHDLEDQSDNGSWLPERDQVPDLAIEPNWIDKPEKYPDGICVGMDCSGKPESWVKDMNKNILMLPYELGRRDIECKGCAYPFRGIVVDILGIVADVELVSTVFTEWTLTAVATSAEAAHYTQGAISGRQDKGEIAQEIMFADAHATTPLSGIMYSLYGLLLNCIDISDRLEYTVGE